MMRRPALGIEEKYEEVRHLINLGRERGYLLYDEINDVLPEEVHSPEDLDDMFLLFDSLGIGRDNKKRLETEAQARQQRASLPIGSNRVDNSQPMFNSSRPSHNGGGSFHTGLIGWLLVLLVLKLGREVLMRRAR